MRLIRQLLGRWIAFHSMTRVLARREIARESAIPLSRQALRLDFAGAELTFDDMIAIVYRARPLSEAVALQLTNVAAFWKCRAELAITPRDREEAKTFESIVTDAAIDLVSRKLRDRTHAWVHGLIEARVREEWTHHPDYVPPQWQKRTDRAAA